MTSLELTGSGTPDFNEGNVYFIGNATTLIRFGGLTILTDPAFLHKGEHVYLGHGIWARREVEPACQIDDVAAQELDKRLPIVSTADAVDKLSALGFQHGYPLDTWESLVVHKGDATLNITAMPAKHAIDEAVNELLMPVNGHLLDFSRNGDNLYRLYITGDTMLVDSLEDIPRRYPDIDLGLIHTGGTTFLVTVVTMTGEQGVRAVEITKPRTAIPIHYNDFSVFLSGLDDFKKAAQASATTTKFVYLAHGETYTFTPNG
jgi:L-ascorbate metabolism protein UlaG (beta-lactamase superfamily)